MPALAGYSVFLMQTHTSVTVTPTLLIFWVAISENTENRGLKLHVKK